MSTDDTDGDILFVLPEGVARDGSAIHIPADAADEIVKRYKEIRADIGDPYGEEDDDFAKKMREFAVPMEENLLMYLNFLAEALRTTADNAEVTGNNYQVTEEDNISISGAPDPDNLDGGGGRR